MLSKSNFLVLIITISRSGQVTNPGQSIQTLGSAFLNIMWPYELSNGKWLLYPTSLHFQNHPHTHCTHSLALNPLRLSASLTDPAQPAHLKVRPSDHLPTTFRAAFHSPSTLLFYCCRRTE